MTGLSLRNCLVTALATPITEALESDAGRLAARGLQLLAEGCDGLALFGTTGEGPHFPLAQRQAALERAIAAGLPSARLIVAVNATALADAIAAARHALRLDVAGILLMPPFYLRGAAREAGVERFYDAFVAGVGSGDLRLFLYNFPDISGFRLPVALIRRLADRHGARVAGVKDSGGDWEYTAAVIAACPDLAVMTGTEVHLPRLLAAGGAGSICGLGNILPKLLRRLIDRPDLADRLVPAVQALDDVVSAEPFVPALKSVVAELTEDAAWRRVMPPLAPLDEAVRPDLVRRFLALLVAANSI